MSDAGDVYPMLGGRTPVMMVDAAWAEKYSRESAQMNLEYNSAIVEAKQSFLQRLKSSPANAFRSDASRRAFDEVFGQLTDDDLCVSVGGGPIRVHPLFTNLNIGPFPNVDVVGDGHRLPYADSSVDAIHSEAVFEHLHSPLIAAKEIARVLKPGGKAFICTPFLQAYHGYPHHYQNYTITGHQTLFESVGLAVIDSGVCVGPAHCLADLISQFVREFMPINKLSRAIWGSIRIAIAPIVRFADKRFTRKPNAHFLASTTYLVAVKP